MASKKDIMRLLAKGVSQNEIAKNAHCSKRTVSMVAKAMRENGITEEDLPDRDEASIRQEYFPRKIRESGYREPDFEGIAKRLSKNTKLTLKYLWFDYSNCITEDGKLYSYSQFCKRYSDYCKKHGVVARMAYEAGKILYIDWAGDVGWIVSKTTGRKSKVYLFVVCLPYSGYLYIEGFADTKQRSWLTGHIHAFEYFGGVPKLLVPDNCATATDRGPVHTTKINDTYFEFADHYGCAVFPARIRRPRDKGLVEASVDLAEKWVLAPLSEDTFYTLDEFNAAVADRLEWLNGRAFQQKEGSRASNFAQGEREHLIALPDRRYEMFEWRRCKVAPNYHVRIDYMNYSVSCEYISQVLDVRVSASRVDILKDDVVIASHERLWGFKGQYSTKPEHMPANHRDIASPWSPERFTDWAVSIGPATEGAIGEILASRAIVEQSFVACLNVLNLSKKHGADVLEEACKSLSERRLRASYTTVKNAIQGVKEKRAGELSAVQTSDDHLVDRLKCGGRTRGSEHYRRKTGA